MKQLLDHILAMADDAHFNEHPEWHEIVRRAEALKEVAEESEIKEIEMACNTGGNVLNDVIVLKDGIIIRISDNLVCVYMDEQADEEGVYASTATRCSFEEWKKDYKGATRYSYKSDDQLKQLWREGK